MNKSEVLLKVKRIINHMLMNINITHEATRRGKYTFTSEAIKYLLWILMLFMLYSFGVALYEALKYKPLWNLKGISNILLIFDTPIKISVASLAILTIWMTLERMKQTQSQLEELSSNNRFNNYFVHKKEFIAEFKDNKLFVEFVEITNKDVSIELKNIYNEVYYKSPNTFEPQINSNTAEKINKLLFMMNAIGLNDKECDLKSISNSDLFKITSENILPIKLMITSIHSKLIPKMREASNIYGVNKSKRNYTHFILLNELFFSFVFYDALLRFDGNTTNLIPDFALNFIEFREGFYYDEAKAMMNI